MDFLNRLFDWLFQFVPRCVLVGPHERGVRITYLPFFWQWSRVKEFGWYLMWPLIQEFYVINVKPQILMIEVYRTDREDPIWTNVSTWAIQFWSQDPYKTMFEVEDHEERLAAHAIKVIGDRTEKNLPVDTRALSEIRAGVQGFGLWIQDILPQQTARVLSVKLFTENISAQGGRIIGDTPTRVVE